MDTTRVTGQEQPTGSPNEESKSSAVAGEQRAEAEASGSEGHANDAADGDSSEQAPGRKRRRRRRRRSGGGEGPTPEAEASDAAATDATARQARGRPKRHASERPSPERPKPAPNSARARTLSTLTSGLFSHLDDRPVACKVEGCSNTWLWTAEEQIQSFGQPPPRRMCAEHASRSHRAEDRDVPCARPGCSRTWTWPKAAQLAQVQKGGSLEAPSRVCEACRKEEREVADREVTCRTDGCDQTWTWTKDAQLRHRAWLRHQGEGAQGAEPEEGKGRNKRRRRRKASADGPPKRLCQKCHDRLGQLGERETTCKVHGCTRTVVIDKESQLRMWVAQGGEQPDPQAPLPKRMCEVCREFCRIHSDRDLPCGRPGCENTWTFKTGAQLQAFLAGRFDDPIRLCESCALSGAEAMGASTSESLSPENEKMPCVVPGCEGTWNYEPGVVLVAAEDGDLPIDRMCGTCRSQRGDVGTADSGSDGAGDASVASATSGPAPDA